MHDHDGFTIGEEEVKRGETKTIYLSLARLFDFTELKMPVRIIRGKLPGPTLFVSGGIHGDEVIGPEIVRRLLHNRRLKDIKGTLIAVPIVNVFGYNTMSRYLPDRRDLNRSFPGSKNGSLAARIANIFVEEILKKCDVGIDLHSGSYHRTNLPQIRANLDDQETERLAKAFEAPVILNSQLRDGSLRETANELGVKMLLFEAGEGLRIDESMIRLATKGILQVMESIGMLKRKTAREPKPSQIAKSSYWLRAPQSGSFRVIKNIGTLVQDGTRLALITDSFGENRISVFSKSQGIVIGQNRLPVVNKGDALFHIATFEDFDAVNEWPEEYGEFVTKGWEV